MKTSDPHIPVPVPTSAHDNTDHLYRFLIESLSEYAVFAISPAGVIVTWNSGAQNTFGFTCAEVIGKPFALIFTPEDQSAGAPQRELADAAHGRRVYYERWHIRRDGTRFCATDTVAPMYDRAGTLLGFTKLVADTTETYRAREALRDSEERLRLLIESVPEYAIFSLAADGSIVTWNSAARRTLGYDEEEIVGKNFSQLFVPDDVANGVPAIMLQKATALGAVDEERWFVRKDGTRFLGSEKIGRLKSTEKDSAMGFVHVAHDITARNEYHAELQRRASLDHLTELPNRKAFLEHLDRSIAAMKRRTSTLFAVLFIDVDHFKEVNDTFGHFVADRLLEVTARRLEQCARKEDVVARIGGDEFAVLLNGINDIDDANDAADRISCEMRKPVPIDAHTVRATVSVGIALGSSRYERPEDVLRDADVAMYSAKADGRGRTRIFDGDAIAVLSDSDLESDLRHAVDRNELRVAYQPIIRLADGALAGFEALARWQHPRRGLLHPVDFIIKAEESDLIAAIDRWVLGEACKTLARWRRQFGRSDLTVSVNFSSKEFSDPDVLGELRHVLTATGLPPSALHLEITESTFMERSDRTTSLLEAIHAFGIELQVDDFGVGYSSLAALGHMPVGALKIDRSFTGTMASRNGGVLVRSIINLAHNLGLAAIAEGIETAEQLGLLTAGGCEFGQGYFLSRPIDATAASRYLGKIYAAG